MSKIKKDALYGIVDQGLISLSNLGIGFLLIKLTSKDDYGLYGIAFAIILLCVGFSNALVTSQMTVFAPEKPDKLKYCFCMLMGQYSIFVPLWFLFAVVSCVGFQFSLISQDILFFSLVVSATVMAAILHDFMRRYFYINLKPKHVLQIDIVNVMIIFASLSAAVIYKLELSHVSAVMIYGVGALAAGIIGMIRARLWRAVKGEEITNAVKEAWHQGRWALGGVVVTWLQSQGYVALLSIMATPSSVAEANAARLLISPVGVVSASLGQVFIPRLAILRNDEKHDAVIDLANKILLLIITVIGVIVFTVYVIKDYLISNFFPKEYSGIGSLFFLWAVVYVALAVRTNASMLLQIYKKFKIITICNFYTALATILMTWGLIGINGIEGSIQANLLGELLLALLLWRIFNYQKIKLD